MDSLETLNELALNFLLLAPLLLRLVHFLLVLNDVSKLVQSDGRSVAEILVVVVRSPVLVVRVAELEVVLVVRGVLEGRRPVRSLGVAFCTEEKVVSG